MKRITALVVSLILVLSALCCPVITSAAESADVDMEATILNQLGFLRSIPEDLSQTVTRGEMVQIIVDMMNGSIIEATGAVITDINEFHDYYPAMTRAIKLGLVTGPVTRPDDAVTYNEAIKMLICMLGYNEYALHKGGWPSGYNIMANSIGLLDGINAVGSTPVTYGDAIRLLYNAIGIDVLEPVNIGQEDVQYGTREGRTILVQTLDIQTAEGVVEAVNGKALYGDREMEGSRVIIDGLKLSHDFVNMSDYVGYKVEFYYDINTKAVKAFYPVENNVKVVDAEAVYEYADNVIWYDGEDFKEEKVSFSKGAIILYNDVVIEDFSGEYFKDKQGEFKFVDNDGDGKYDVIFLDITEDYVVKVADAASGMVYDYYDTTRTVCLADKEDMNVKFIDEFGRDMLLSELMRYDVISVKKSLDGKNVIAIYSNSEVRGAVEASGITNGRSYVVIDGVTYDTTDGFAKHEKLKLGEWGVFGLTSTGKVASINRGFASDGTSYGYLINGKPTAGVVVEYKYRVLSQNGGVISLTSAQKVNVDGKSMSAADAYAYLGGENIAPQPIVLETNKDGLLARIDTIIYNPETEIRDSLSEMYNGYDTTIDEDDNIVETSRQTLEWRSGTGIFGSKIATSSNTVLFKVAKDKNAPDEEFGVSKLSELGSSNAYYTVKAYKTVADSHMADIIVLYSSAVSGDTGNTTYVVSEISQSMDSKENAVTKIVAYANRNASELYVKDESILSNIKWYKAGTADAALDHELAPGDIIMISKDAEGYVSSISLIFDIHNKRFYSSTNYDGQNANAQFRISYNEVYSVYSNNILVHKGPITEEPIDAEGRPDYTKLESYNAGGFTILVYDPEARDNPVRVGTVADLSDYKTTGEGSKIFLQSAYTTNGKIVVFR